MTTSNKDLENISRYLNIPKPIICFDEDLLHRKMKNTEYFVINLGSMADGGTHWVGLAIRGKKEACYFDPFGVIWSTKIATYISKCSKKGYNETQIQNISSNLCGWYVMMWLDWIQKSNKDMFKATNEFVNEFWSDYDGNGELLKMMYINNYHLPDYLKNILLNGIS
jgi:hypothetical protein